MNTIGGLGLVRKLDIYIKKLAHDRVVPVFAIRQSRPQPARHRTKQLAGSGFIHYGLSGGSLVLRTAGSRLSGEPLSNPSPGSDGGWERNSSRAPMSCGVETTWPFPVSLTDVGHRLICDLAELVLWLLLPLSTQGGMSFVDYSPMMLELCALGLIFIHSGCDRWSGAGSDLLTHGAFVGLHV
ncbi:hypothetical protein LX32DRAFT_242949 [Colletotrichum zoysiae]|uniref:Uncharacterized protein n=1 Tax=Colletotrichum zoysiae TaxID=1216348 RepID=A0AAD9LV44_9PEZI|nr:hypothetical protein LX32DRAFT_242949 [Colletotrichum zoysiae]